MTNRASIGKRFAEGFKPGHWFDTSSSVRIIDSDPNEAEPE
jgi:hypothetical protein